ncbi:PREDICTED: uncharacterized protein LOC107167080 [Diuraphis noxia]|uniref:uncharacterized protein LOC107167080 n=1 Tax=Diuraphis noxia TaxID=143948 RepID=UPI000763ADFF|nr:PREDICTED: uncharacterized protein LOC107167080 [Diuraphis noxia]
MSKNGVDVCISAQCCCKLITKVPEKPAPVPVVKPRNACSERAKKPEMSLCDFLKSQPLPDWIKALQDNSGRATNSKDKQCGSVRSVAAPAPVNRICSEPTDLRAKHSQNHQQDIHQSSNQLPSAVHEDRNMSQIIINIGTMITNRVCKQNSYQQTDPEVQTSVGPPTKRPTSACPPVECPTSICPKAEKSTTDSPPAEHPTAVIPPKVQPLVIGSIPVSQDHSCRYQGNPSSAISSTEQKPFSEPKIKSKMNCCCTCHSNV